MRRLSLPLVLLPCPTAIAIAQGADGTRRDPAAPVPATVVRDLQYHDGFARSPRRNELDLYLPRDVQSPPLVMFVHGGAWTGGSKDFGAPLAHALAQHGIACACINTQQFPFGKPAAMVMDCGHALAWLHRNAKQYGYDGDRLFMLGHSSGGHLVSWLALDGERLASAGVPRSSLRGAVALSGVYEVRTRHVVLEKVFGNDLSVRRDGSPLTHASAGDPPMLLLWGERDLAGLSLCGRMLRDRLRDSDVSVVAEELAGRDHIDYVLGLGNPRDAVLSRIVAFVQAPPGAPPAAIERRRPAAPVSLRLAGADVVVQRPEGPVALATVVWVVTDPAEQALATAVGNALVPFGAAFVRVAGAADAGRVAALWRQLRMQAAILGVPAPTCLGGTARGGALVLAADLARRDGLHGRVVLGGALGQAPDLLAKLAISKEQRPSLLLAQGDGDPKAQRDITAAFATQLVIQQFDVHLIDSHRGSTARAIAGLGDTDDVLLPALRAFALP